MPPPPPPNGSVEMESNYEWTYGSREVATGTQIAFLANLAFDSAQESSDGCMFPFALPSRVRS